MSPWSIIPCLIPGTYHGRPYFSNPLAEALRLAARSRISLFTHSYEARN
jgi:hypothetical protein